jgi:hypothetical protein
MKKKTVIYTVLIVVAVALIGFDMQRRLNKVSALVTEYGESRAERSKECSRLCAPYLPSTITDNGCYYTAADKTERLCVEAQNGE